MTQYRWLNVNGDWTTASDWSPNTGYPTGADTALIYSTAAFTLAIGSAELVAAMSIVMVDSSATLDISQGAKLSLGNTFNFDSGTIDLSGVLNGGTVVDNGGVLVSGVSLGNLGGTLDNVTWQGTLDLSSDNTFVNVTDGLTLTSTGGNGAGVLNLTGNGSQLTFENSLTLNGATVNFGASSSTAYLTLQSPTSQAVTLTLGPSLVMNEAAPAAQIYFLTSGSGIVNQGTFNVTQPGESLTFQPSLNNFFTNQGTINVENGATLAFVAPGGGNLNLTNVSGNTITGGTFDVFSNSALQLLAGSSITSDSSDITLNGAGSTIESLIGIAEVSLDTTLSGITSTGDLRLLSGRSYSAVLSGFDDAGVLQVGGGTFSGGSLSVTNTATLFGYGVIATGLINNGEVLAKGGVLTLNVGGGVLGSGSMSIDPTGTLDLNSQSSQSVTFLAPISGVGGAFRIETGTEYTGTISGLTYGDTIDVGNYIITSASIDTGNNRLVANIQGGGSLTYQLSAGDYSGYLVNTSGDGRTGTNLVIACFAKGTLISTPDGDRAVEDLCAGDAVCTAEGVARPVLWMARRTLSPGAFGEPFRAQPVRITAGAFGDGLPRRDLWLSPEHAVHVDEMLVPVRHLVNGTSIVQEQVDEIAYFHVVLDVHAVLLAEGMPSESWRDEGSDIGFENPISASIRARLPRLACAPVVTSGPSLEMLRRRLARRSMDLGFPQRRICDVHLARAGSNTVPVPAGTSEIRLRAPARRPHGDRRDLGVAITGVWVGGMPIGLDDPRLARGFHAVEGAEGMAWRWTEGEASIEVAVEADTQIVVDVFSMANRAA